MKLRFNGIFKSNRCNPNPATDSVSPSEGILSGKRFNRTSNDRKVRRGQFRAYGISYLFGQSDHL